MKDNNVFLPAQNFFKEFPWVPRIPCWHPCLNYFSTYPENLSTVIYQSFGKSKSVTVKKITFNRGFSIQYGQFQQRNILFQVTIWHLWNLQKIIEREFIWISVLGHLPCLWKMKFEIESSLNRPTFSVGRLSLMKQCLNPNLGESFRGLFYGGREVLKLPTSLKLFRIMLETSNLLRKYTHISSSKKYNL